MTDTTTVRVRRTTHDELTAAVRRQGSSADEVIRAALRALEREETRQRYEADVRRIADDPADRDEVAQAIRELRGE